MLFMASRVTDYHACPMVSGPVLHVGGPILPIGHPTVLIGSRLSARGTDQATCVGPLDFIVTGAGTVFTGGKPAARVTSATMHGGKVVLGCFTVFIGGPSVGVTLGNPAAVIAAIEASGLRNR